MDSFDEYSPIANKYLQSDGTLVDNLGNPLPPSNEWSDEFKSMNPKKNQYLNYDGSTKPIVPAEGGGGGTND